MKNITLILCVVIFINGCYSGSGVSEKVDSEAETTDLAQDKPFAKESKVEQRYSYEDKNCSYGYLLENNHSICLDEQGEIDNPILLSKREFLYKPCDLDGTTYPDPPASTHNETYEYYLDRLINSPQYKKDFFCQEFIERTYVAIHTFNENRDTQNFKKYDTNYKESIGVHFLTENNTTHIVVVDSSGEKSKYIYNSFSDSNFASWSDKTVSTDTKRAIDYHNGFLAKPDGETICIFADGRLFCKNGSDDSEFSLVDDYSDAVFEEDTNVFKLDETTALVMDNDYPKTCCYLSATQRFNLLKFMDSNYTKEYLPDYIAEVDMSVGSNIIVRYPLIENNEWGNSFIGKRIREGFVEDNYLGHEWEFFKVNDNFTTSQLKIAGNYMDKEMADKRDTTELLYYTGSSYRKPTGILSFEKTRYIYNNPIVEEKDNLFYFFTEDENGRVTSVSFDEYLGIDFKKYKNALDYFYQPFYAHLNNNGILHIFSVVNSCQNVSAEYKLYDGYEIEGAVDGELYHYIIDLNKENYLEPIFEEKVLEFQW